MLHTHISHILIHIHIFLYSFRYRGNLKHLLHLQTREPGSISCTNIVGTCCTENIIYHKVVLRAIFTSIIDLLELYPLYTTFLSCKKETKQKDITLYNFVVNIKKWGMKKCENAYMHYILVLKDWSLSSIS